LYSLAERWSNGCHALAGLFCAWLRLRGWQKARSHGACHYLPVDVFFQTIHPVVPPLAAGSPNEDYSGMKRGILLVAFGANSKQANDTLSLVDERVRSAFPGVNVRWAFTSELIRDRLAEQRVKTDSVRKALEKMGFERYTHVAVQSLHIIPGVEYEDLLADGAAMREQGRLSNVVVGSPLLHSDADVAQAAAAMLRHLPPQRTPQEAVVFMGHGTWHSGDSRYEDLSRAVRDRDSRIFIGTMDGNHTIDDLLPLLQAAGRGRVWLLPLLSVVGRHARRDMAGDEPQSWKSRLEGAGMECLPVLTGVAEYSGFVDIWIQHLAAALERLDV